MSPECIFFGCKHEVCRKSMASYRKYTKLLNAFNFFCMHRTEANGLPKMYLLKAMHGCTAYKRKARTPFSLMRTKGLKVRNTLRPPSAEHRDAHRLGIAVSSLQTCKASQVPPDILITIRPGIGRIRVLQAHLQHSMMLGLDLPNFLILGSRF